MVLLYLWLSYTSHLDPYLYFFEALWIYWTAAILCGQLLLLYYIYRLFLGLTWFIKLLYLVLILSVSAGFLLYLQLEALACLIFLNEIIICLFWFIFFIYCSPLNIRKHPIFSYSTLLIVCGVVGFSYVWSFPAVYSEVFFDWVWYDCYLFLYSFHYNDLYVFYLYYYLLYPTLLLTCGVLLFFCTVLFLSWVVTTLLYAQLSSRPLADIEQQVRVQPRIARYSTQRRDL